MDSPLVDWFMSFPDDSIRCMLLDSILDSAERFDPGLKRSKEIWKKDKTTKYHMDIAINGESIDRNIHILIEQDDSRLFDMFVRRIREHRNLKFEVGTTLIFGKLVKSVTAQMLNGSVSIYEHDDSLVFIVRARPVVKLPSGLEVGKASPLGKQPSGAMVKLFEGSLVCVFSFPNLSDFEKNAIANAEPRFGLIKVSQGCLMMCVDIKGMFKGFAELPFSIAIERESDRMLMPQDSDGRMYIPLIAIDNQTGVTHVVRIVSVERLFADEFMRLVEDQAAMKGYGLAEYNRDLSEFYAKHPDWESTWRLLSHVVVGRDESEPA